MISFYLYKNPMGHIFIMTEEGDYLEWSDYIKYESNNWIKKEIQKIFLRNDIHLVKTSAGFIMVVID